MHHYRVLRLAALVAELIALLLGAAACESISGNERVRTDERSRDTAGRDVPASDRQVISRPRNSPRDPAVERRERQRDIEGSGSTSSIALYGMSAEEFLDSRDARRKIDLDRVDDELLAAAVFHETNRRRAKAGLPPLRHRAELDDAAMMQARDMARRGKLTHDHSDGDLREPLDRASAAGLEPRFVAENIATAFGIRYESGRSVYVLDGSGVEEGRGDFQRFSYEPRGEPIPNHTYRTFARDLVDGWMGSHNHRRNILHGEPTHMGHACVRGTSDKGMPVFYCAQEFCAEAAREAR